LKGKREERRKKKKGGHRRYSFNRAHIINKRKKGERRSRNTEVVKALETSGTKDRQEGPDTKD